MATCRSIHRTWYFAFCIFYKSKTRVTSSNPWVRRLKTRVGRLKAGVGRLKHELGD